MIDKAIILAAGTGRRMGATKPLLPLSEEGLNFLDWHIRSLTAYGVQEIFIVGNPKTFGAKVEAIQGITTKWIMNASPASDTGSGHSTYLAFTSEHEILDSRSRVILMDADVVYDPSIFSELVSSKPGPSKTLICSKYRETCEEVMVFADANRTPRVQGKGLLATNLVSKMSCLGEATGLLLLEPKDHSCWQQAALWCMQYSTAKTLSEHEDITQLLMNFDKIDAVSFDDDRRFMECDTPDEYKAVCQIMVPRWRASLP